ncbi:MAG: sulfatase [Opitutales bacterium]
MRPTLLLAALCATFIGHATAQAKEAGKPNILFVIADDWGNGHAGAYGCSWVKTPNFDRVAKEGLLFLNAYTPTAKCAPSRSAIMTGRHPWLLGAAANHTPNFPPEIGILPEALAKAGYFYASTGKVWGPGESRKADGSPRPMTGKVYQKRRLQPPAKAIAPNDYAANFADFLQDAPKGQPWFFWLGFQEPHRAYEEGSHTRFGKKPGDVDRVPNYWPDNATVRGDMLDYAVEVEHLDAHLGKVLAQLEALGELDRTLIIVTSDNGMPFPRVKGSTYENANHLPFAVRWPVGIPESSRGRKVAEFVSFVDLAPTFLEAAELPWEKSGLLPTSGRSLFDIFKSGGATPAAGRDFTLIGRERNDLGRPGDVGYPTRGIVKDGLIYLENAEPSRWPACNPETGYLDTDASPTKSFILQARRDKGSDPFWELCFGMRPGQDLYDLRTDPDCVRNLAVTRQADAEKLRTQMWAELKRQGDLRALGRGAEYEAHPHPDVKRRGFYERYMKGEPINAGWVDKTDFEPAPVKPAR